MPVILAEDDWPKWLGEEPEASKNLGSVRNNGPQLVLPALSNELPA